MKDPNKRLGGGEADGKDVMAHPFFASIDFVKMENREAPPPFVPKIKDDTDTGNFDPYFTNEAPLLTPEDASAVPNPSDKETKFEKFEAHKK